MTKKICNFYKNTLKLDLNHIYISTSTIKYNTFL